MSSAVCVAALEKFSGYITAFNTQDLPSVSDCLDEDIQVYVDGELASQGKQTILPAYERDFAVQKQVTVVKDPAAIERKSNQACSQGAVEISVGLDNGSVTLDVLYTFRIPDLKQIRHDITNIKTIQRK
ncbi:MAG: hypothetical protein SGCHY_002221 [Lobulomycetales sp.]